MQCIKNSIWWENLVNFWKEYAQALPKSDDIFQVSDFDYTLFSRDEQFEKIPELLEHRKDEGPKYIFEEYWLEKFLDELYRGKEIPTQIIEKLVPWRDIIITKWWSRDFQLAKIRSCKQLDDFLVITTKTEDEKIVELIRYVLFELGEIPKEIIVYEDRPENFIEHRNFIEDVLGTELTIMNVEMDGNRGYKSIEEV